MPEGLPPALWDSAANAVKVDEVTKQFIEMSKATTARLAAVPEKPDGYKLELPADFKAPEGMKVTFDEKDPRVAALRTLAHANQWDQKTVSGILAIEAQREVAAENAKQATMIAETAKLGEKGPVRQQAVATFLSAHFKPEQIQAFAADKLQNAAAFEVAERLIQMATASGMAGGAPPPPAPKPSEIPMKDRWYGGSQQKVS